jgi:hypothetical protein
MKKSLLLSLLLLGSYLSSLAQTITVPIEIWNAVTNTFSYSVSAPRNYQTYPLNSSGKIAFEQAVVAGTFSLTTTDGCLIPIGTRPPKTKPTCTTQPPSQTAVIAYNQSFGVSGKGTGAEYPKPGTIDGIIKEGTLSWSIPNIPAPGSYTLSISYQSNVAVPTAQFSVNGGANQNLVLTASGGELRTATTTLTSFTTGTNTLVMTPSGYMTTASIQISRAGSTTVTDPGSQTTSPGSGSGTIASFANGYFGGNSFTKVPPIGGTAWDHESGMAASSASKDYAHLLQAKIRTVNPSFQAHITSALSPFETEYLNNTYDYQARITNELYAAYSGNVPNFDLVSLSIGENIIESSFNKTAFFARLDQLIATIPKANPCTVVLRSSFWSGHETSSAALLEYANTKGYKYVSFTDRVDYPAYQATQYTDAGIRKHWNDLGHQEITNRYVTALSSTTTTSPGTTDPTFDYVSQSDEGWINSDATDLKTIENNVIKVGFRRQVGGAICWAGFKSTNRNLVNDPIMNDARVDDPYGRYGKSFRDKGRQWMFAPYYSPGTGYIVNGKNTANYGYDTGGNVVQGGSLGNYYDESVVVASRIYNHPKFGQTYWVKVQPRVWGVPGELVDFYIEQWCHFLSPDSPVLVYYERSTVGNIQTSQFKYEARAQELPCFYSIAPLTYQRVTHQDATPWTGGSTVDRFKYGFGNNNNFTKSYATPECFLSLGEGENGVTVGLYTPGVDRGDGKRVGLNSRFKAGQFNDVVGNSDQLPSAYGTAAPMVNFDNAGVYETGGYFVLGTSFADVRSRISALPRPDQSFDFDFSSDLHAWWNLNCRFKKESGGGWTAYLGDLNQDGGTHGEVKSPFGAWAASGITTIEFDMAVSGATAFWLEWNKMGEENDDSRRYRKAFTGLIGDGVRRTYTISTSDPNWAGFIASVGLKAIANDGQNQGNPTTSAGASVKLYRIRKK